MRRMSAEERAKVFKALSDPTRIDMVDALAKHGPLCGTELAERLGISLSLVSHHWDVLVEAGLIRKKREGQLRVCTLDPGKLQEATGDWERAILVEAAEAGRKSAKKGKKSAAAAAKKKAKRKRKLRG